MKAMGLLKIIRQDIALIKSKLGPKPKLVVAIVATPLVVGLWFLGGDWWMQLTTPRFSLRERTRLEFFGVVGAIFVGLYLFSVVYRYRRPR